MRLRVLPSGSYRRSRCRRPARRCRREGETVRRLIDCLIAAVAIGAPVLHRDDDFRRAGPSHRTGYRLVTDIQQRSGGPRTTERGITGRALSAGGGGRSAHLARLKSIGTRLYNSAWAGWLRDYCCRRSRDQPPAGEVERAVGPHAGDGRQVISTASSGSLWVRAEGGIASGNRRLGHDPVHRRTAGGRQGVALLHYLVPLHWGRLALGLLRPLAPGGVGQMGNYPDVAWSYICVL